jgi:hypothetical protein
MCVEPPHDSPFINIIDIITTDTCIYPRLDFWLVFELYPKEFLNQHGYLREDISDPQVWPDMTAVKAREHFL